MTTIGGMVFADCKDGYGPQEYCLRRLMPGRYVIKIGNFANVLLRRTTVQATVITNFGRPTEKRQVFSVVVNDTKESIEVGAVMLGEGERR